MSQVEEALSSQHTEETEIHCHFIYTYARALKRTEFDKHARKLLNSHNAHGLAVEFYYHVPKNMKCQAVQETS